jgi:prepilin-type N-terminal cleavage/methylation domain-containing protein
MRKGFTLIELLVVIAILAVMSVAVVLVLNPAELIRQGRDATRMSDLAAINSAISLLVADKPSASWSATTTCTFGTTGMAVSATTTCAQNSSTSILGTGWINVDFTQISSGAPLSKLPLDPDNGESTASGKRCDGTLVPKCFYEYNASSSVGIFKLYANMESTKYANGGSSDTESNTKDGGTVGDWYEVGANLLAL